MIFYVIETDYKMSWNRYKEDIKWAIEKGLVMQQEVSGDEFGSDGKYLVMTEDTIDSKEAIKLVQITCHELYAMENKDDYEDDEWEEMIENSENWLLENYEQKQETDYDSIVLKCNNREVYTLIMPKED